MLIVLLGLGLISGIVSGLLGIGGAIVIVPALLYIPQWLGLATIDIRTAAAIAVAQVVAAALTGTLVHRRRGLVHGRLGVTMGIGSASGALFGGIISAYLPAEVLLGIAATLATSAATVMVVPISPDPLAGISHPAFRLPIAVPIGFAIGLLIGTIGIGSFLMVPTLIHVLRVPTRVAMATVLAVAFPTATAALAGKIVTGQVPFMESAAMVLGAVPGAHIGSALSMRVPARALRVMYGSLVMIAASGLWYDVLHTTP